MNSNSDDTFIHCPAAILYVVWKNDTTKCFCLSNKKKRVPILYDDGVRRDVNICHVSHTICPLSKRKIQKSASYCIYYIFCDGCSSCVGAGKIKLLVRVSSILHETILINVIMGDFFCLRIYCVYYCILLCSFTDWAKENTESTRRTH